jgi:outer membrane protein OmpA-like peptidoglycan-associated protein
MARANPRTVSLADAVGNQGMQRLREASSWRRSAVSVRDEVAPALTPARARKLDAALAEPAAPLPEGARRLHGDTARDVRLRWGPSSEALARDLEAVAFTRGADVFVDTRRFRPGSAAGDLVFGHELAHAREQRGRPPTLALLTEAQFRAQLGARPEQATVIDTLFANATFRALWDYLGSCPATPTQDHGPIRLLVTPGLGLMASGIERFGGYSLLARTLEINPTKPEHVANPQELVDTIVHEVIHAVDDVQTDCIAAGGPPAPLRGAATAVSPSAGGLPPLGPTELGPGASNPCDESIDINVAAQLIVTEVITQNLRTTRIGMPTITFVNDLLRSDAAARTAYDACRRTACALPSAAGRQAAIGRCNIEVLGTFMSGTLLPSRVLFDFDSDAIRPDSAQTLELVATFLRAHPTTHVRLVGHADPVGRSDYNQKLGQRRAGAVRDFLLARGVDPAQIDETSSRGEEQLISGLPAQHFQDRRVEIIPLSRAPGP